MFNMKKIVSAMTAAWMLAGLLIMMTLTSCDKNEPTVPDVSLEIQDVYDTSVEFTVTAHGASLLTYKLLSEYDALPSADELLTSGTMADPELTQVYNVRNLEPETQYRIAAAARYADGRVSAVCEKAFTTEESQAIVPSLVLRDAVALSTSIKFTLVPDKAEKVAYMCVPASEGVPTPETILSEGQQADPGMTDQYAVAGLASLTEYIIAAVAESADGTCSEVQSETVTTLEPEPVAIGDWYYSDGTWSSGAQSPLEGKDCIGIVVLTGRSTVANGEDTGVYYTKNGSSRMDNINGYVIALKDVAGGKTFAWGSHDVDGDDGAGTTHLDTDFMGYYNTMQIKAKAEEKAGGLSDDPVNNYPAAYAAVELYEEEVPAPEISSGWFLPSAQQMHYAYLYNEVIDEAIAKLGDAAVPILRNDARYWSSTEHWAQNGCRYWSYMVCLDSSVFDPGYISAQQKTKEYKVRAWLVF